MAAATRTLIFGGSYFIGRVTADFLTAAGHAVTVLNRGTRPLAHVSQVIADRDDHQALWRALDGAAFDLVVDFSCYRGPQAERALTALDGRFHHWVHVSSAAVYCDNVALPTSEEDALGGHPAWSDYGREKSTAESVLRASPYTDRITILRPPYVYGPGNTVDRERFVWSRLLRGRPVLVPGAGETVVQFVHVEDVARAIDAVARQPEVARGKTYNVGEKHATTLLGWVRAAAKAADVEPQVVHVPRHALQLEARAFFPFRDLTMFVDTHRIEQELAFYTRFSLQDGLAQTFATYDVRELRERTIDTTQEERIVAAARAPSAWLTAR